MADAYGAIVMGFSDDFDGDKEEIARVLSEKGLSNSGIEFEVDDGVIKSCSSWVDAPQYPTLTPMRSKIVRLLIDGKIVEKCIDELSEEEGDNIYDVIDEEVIPLKDFASELAQHIDIGTLYLTCCSNEKQRSACSEYMSVCADGSAKRVYISQWVGKPATFIEETC
jgi:hypothetical protein